MARQITTTPKNKPKAGQSLHTWIAQGGDPKKFNAANKTAQLRASSTKKAPKYSTHGY